jgi:hypothetical protein
MDAKQAAHAFGGAKKTPRSKAKKPPKVSLL